MSIDAMSWAFKQDLPPAEKLVLLSLADHHNGGTGKCIPGQASIAEQTSMSVRTVQRHLASLEQRGLIRRVARFRGEGRGRTSDAYILQGDNLSRWLQGDKPRTTKATNQDDQPDTGVVVTGREPEENLTAAAPREKKPRARDPIWDAIVEACGYVNPTGTEAGRAQKAGKELRDINATPEQVHQVAAAYRKKWPDMPLTPQALTGNWNQLLETAKPRKKAWSETNWCPDCGQDADDIYHEELCDAYQQHR